MSLRTAMIALAATALIGTQTVAAEVAPLAAGKPAGVREAQASPRPMVLLVAGAVVIGAVAVAIAASDNASCDAVHCPQNNNPPATGTN